MGMSPNEESVSISENLARLTMGFLQRNLALAPRHTKEVAYKILVSPQLEYHMQHVHVFGIPIIGLRFSRWRRCRRQLLGEPAGHSAGDMLDELEWPSLEARREQSSLTFFYKIHSGTVSLEKVKYLTPAPNFGRTRASHVSQYTRYLAYSDASKVLSSLALFCCGSSVVSSKTPEESRVKLDHRVQRYAFYHASDLLLVNSFNGPSQMFFPLLNLATHHT